MKRGFLFIILAAGFFTSCERTIDTPLDADYTKPYLHDLQVSPDSFNTDTILVNGQTNPQDLLTLTFDCFVTVERKAGTTPPTVRFSVRMPERDALYAEGTLHDNGVTPDVIAGDGIYAGRVNFTIERVDIGDFELSVEGYHEPGSPSNTLLHAIRVLRSSRAPEISDLSAPDTVTLPPAGQVALILMSVAAADSDGSGDIGEVFFRNLDSPSDTTKKFFLYDDGHVTGLSGDSIANDGVFSIVVQLPSSTPPMTYRFLFQATDRSGLSSNAILHPLTILSPE